MQFKRQFIDRYCDNFVQVGNNDEEELSAKGEQNENNVSVELDALHCLRFFPHVTNLILRPGSINKEHLCHLHSLPLKRLKLDYYSDLQDEYTLDLGKFPSLECLVSRTQLNFRNIEKCTHMRTLVVQEWHSSNLEYLDNSNIEKLSILSGRLVSVQEIARLNRLKSISISNQRFLRDITEIAKCRTLEYLEIDSCNKMDLDRIPILPSLRSLVIIGRQEIDNCNFFSRFPALERLVLGVRIRDGDLSPLTNLKHCAILSDYRHYTHKNIDLPKSTDSK